MYKLQIFYIINRVLLWNTLVFLSHTLSTGLHSDKNRILRGLE